MLTRHHTNRGGAVHAAATTSLHFRSTSALAKTPVLLACSQDGNVRFFRLACSCWRCYCCTEANGVMLVPWARGSVQYNVCIQSGRLSNNPRLLPRWRAAVCGAVVQCGSGA